MSLEVIVFLSVVLGLLGSIIFFVVRYFARDNVNSSAVATSKDFRLFFFVVGYFTLLIVLGLSGYRIVAQIMLFSVFIICLVGLVAYLSTHARKNT